MRQVYLIPTFGYDSGDWSPASPFTMLEEADGNQTHKPKFLLLCARNEPFLRDPSYEFYHRLREKQFECSHFEIEGVNHFSIITGHKVQTESTFFYVLTFVKWKNKIVNLYNVHVFFVHVASTEHQVLSFSKCGCTHKCQLHCNIHVGFNIHFPYKIWLLFCFILFICCEKIPECYNGSLWLAVNIRLPSLHMIVHKTYIIPTVYSEDRPATQTSHSH